jgi:hypothetical protein
MSSLTPAGAKTLACSIHLARWPWVFVQGDPPSIHGLPVTWLTNWAALHQYADLLAGFCRDHGDEVAIMEGFLATPGFLDGLTRASSELL